MPLGNVTGDRPRPRPARVTGRQPLACYSAAMIERTDDGPVTTLRLAHGKASALDLELVEAIPPALQEAQLRKKISALRVPAAAAPSPALQLVPPRACSTAAPAALCGPAGRGF